MGHGEGLAALDEHNGMWVETQVGVASSTF